VAVDGAIDVVPTAADASVSLVNSPIEPNRLAIFSACLTEQRQETLNPAVDREVSEWLAERGILVDQSTA